MHNPPPPPSGSHPASTNTGNWILENDTEPVQENPYDWLNSIPNGTIYSYNMDDNKTPGGLKVRWKIRAATGAEGARWDARQAQAIKELLQWAQRHHRLTTPTR
jgi:hypothetical protein